MIADKVESLRAAIEIHFTELTRLRGDTNLSEAGRNTAIQSLYEGALEAVTGIAHEVHEAVEGEITKRRRRATPAPAGTPADVLEGGMANARTDARMVLDPLGDTELHKALATLATNGSEAMRHLILATDWTDLYLRSRDSTTAAALSPHRTPA